MLRRNGRWREGSVRGLEVVMSSPGLGSPLDEEKSPFLLGRRVLSPSWSVSLVVCVLVPESSPFWPSGSILNVAPFLTLHRVNRCP